MQIKVVGLLHAFTSELERVNKLFLQFILEHLNTKFELTVQVGDKGTDHVFERHLLAAYSLNVHSAVKL